MMKTYHSSFCAGAAIAAAFALAPTTALAQVAEAPTISPAPPPVMVFPETVAPPPPTPAASPWRPTIVIPPSLPEVTPPVEAQQVPQVAPPTAARTQTRAAPRPAAASVERAPVEPTAPETSTAAPVEEAATAEPTPIVPVAPVAAVDEPLPAPAATQGDSTSFLLLALAGLVALVLAIWAFVAIGRRKPVARGAAVKVERPLTASAAPEPVSTREPVAATPVYDIRPIAPTPAASLAHTGASVALPRSLPVTFEERDALLKRMIAAKPDRANPFTTYQARVKRARLILQSLGRDFSNTEPWIDLSQYSENWPELARSKYAAA